jgi:hypothetical protein
LEQRTRRQKELQRVSIFTISGPAVMFWNWSNLVGYHQMPYSTFSIDTVFLDATLCQPPYISEDQATNVAPLATNSTTCNPV